MKPYQINQKDSESTELELDLLPAGDFGGLEIKPGKYDGGFHIKSPAANKKRVISKRSTLQDFTCR